MILRRDRNNQRQLGDTDRLMYQLGLVALGIILAAVLLYLCLGISLLSINWGCLFNKITGYPCPGCGGTRAARALLRGDILGCIADYPPLIYGILVYIVFMVRCFLYKHLGIRKSADGRILKHFCVFAMLILAQWLVKLAAQMFFGYVWIYY